jgi:hypothetical protein
MKKMFTLLSGLFLSFALLAADPRPVVTLSSMSNYKVVIDGKAFFTNNSQISLRNLSKGYHSVQVFEMRRGYYQQREKMVSSSSFFLKRNDIRILINRFGDVRIKEIKGFGRFERDDNDWYEKDRHDDNDRDRGPGRGNDRQRF